ncbi:MAG TPA: hypothetical protein VGO89_17230, partial [Streptomyces sp.]|nr:hypothetical protein [Streptomyces sp.]
MWRGYDAALDRPVAVSTIRQASVISPSMAEEFARRFQREARITARIQHPGIPQVYDAVLDEGSYERLPPEHPAMIPSSRGALMPCQRWLTVTRMPDTSFPADADVAGIGPRMLRLRVQLELTQTELAGDRFTRAYVSSIEGGKRTPSPAAATYFAIRLGMDLEDLCFGYPPGRRRALLAEAAEARVVLSDGDTERASAVYEALSAEAELHKDRTLRALGRYGMGLVVRHG